MSLRGLDSDGVTAAHETAIAAAGGWFLLKYIERDEVGLLSTGSEGFVETREAIANYEEDSPLFGLVVFKKKKALLKYVPDGTSRLLQARLAVHLQSVVETFPHEALLSISTAAELTESALNFSLTPLKTSGSVRSANSAKQRPLTEIPEGSDEALQKVSNEPGREGQKEVEHDLGPESPPDPLLSPAPQPFSPVELSNESEARSPVSDRAAASTHTSSHQNSRKGSRDDEALSSPEELSRADTYDYDAEIAQLYKPKVKLGPRPSLDQNVLVRASGTFQRPVATLPAGVRVSPTTQNAPEHERPRTEYGTKPFGSSSPRYGDFSSMQRPKSRAGSVLTLPAFGSDAVPPPPTSPGLPLISPEKQRLMKALEQRKKQQAKKAAQSPTKESSGESAADAQSPVQAQAVSSPDPGAAAPSPPGAPTKEDQAETQSHLPPGSEPLTASKQSTTSPDVVNDKATGEVLQPEQPSTGLATSAEQIEATDESQINVPTLEHRQDVQEGSYLAHSGSLSSVDEGGTREISPLTASPLSVRDTADESKQALAEHSFGQGGLQTVPVALATVDAQGLDLVKQVEDTAGDGKVAATEPSVSAPAAETVTAEDHFAQSVGPSLVSQLPVAPITESHTEEAVPVSQASRVAVDGNMDNHPDGLSAVLQPPVQAEVRAAEPSEITSKKVAVMPTPLEPQSPAVATLKVTEPVNPLSDEPEHDSSESVATLNGLASDIEPPSLASEVTPRDLQATDTDEPPSNDANRFSTTSKTSRDSAIKRLPPITTSKHDSSDLASLDGDSLYEELRSATVEEAQTMVVSRSPATPVFQESPRPGSRRSSENSLLQRAITNPTAPAPTEEPVPKLPKSLTPPSAVAPNGPTVPTAPVSVPVKEPSQSPPQPEPSEPFKPRQVPSRSGSQNSLAASFSGGSSRKASGVSSLISQRIKAFENAGSGSNSATNDRTAVIASSIVSQRKASLSTPPGSAGADSLSGNRSGNRPYPTPSPSPQNGFIARTFGSVRASSPYTPYQSQGLQRQPSRESTSNGRSTSSSRLSSMTPSPVETQKPTTSYFSVPLPSKARAQPISKPSSSGTDKQRSTTGSSSSWSRSRRSSNTSASSERKRDSRASTSSRQSTTSQKSNETARPTSPRSDSSFSSDSNTGNGGDRADKKQSRSSRLLRRMSSIALSPRRNIAEALSPSLSDQAIAESNEAGSHTDSGVSGAGSSASSRNASATLVQNKKWKDTDMGDLSVQFPDTLLWKRRNLRVDDAGNLVLKPGAQDKNIKIAPKHYHMSQFRAPYVPDQDREEMPHSIILDFMDGSTLQCSCTDRAEQMRVLQMLGTAHVAFTS